jgi:hypothetical protein
LLDKVIPTSVVILVDSDLQRLGSSKGENKQRQARVCVSERRGLLYTLLLDLETREVEVTMAAAHHEEDVGMVKEELHARLAEGGELALHDRV